MSSRSYRCLLAGVVLGSLLGAAVLSIQAQHAGSGEHGRQGPSQKEVEQVEHGTPEGWKFTWPQGNPVKGREVFLKLECYSCHEVKGERFPVSVAFCLGHGHICPSGRRPRVHHGELAAMWHYSMTSQNVAFTTVIDGGEMLDSVLPVLAGGPATHFVRAIDHYGDGSQDASNLWWKAGASLFDGDDLGGGVFPEILNPPELALAEVKAAKVYRDLANRWR